MSEFRPSRWSEIPALRALWKAAFGDSDAYLDLFFSTAYAPDRSIVLPEGNVLLGAAYWLDCHLDDRKLAYLYAVAIDPAHQNRGLGTALMQAIHARLAESGYQAALLVPGDEGLRRYYQRLGYETISHRNEYTARPGTPLPLRPITAEEYALARQRYLPEPAVIQEEENLALLARLAQFYEGPGFAAAMAKDEPVCLELLGADTAPGITAALGFDTCRFFGPGDRIPYAMAKSLDGTPMPPNLYFGFGFE